MKRCQPKTGLPGFRSVETGLLRKPSEQTVQRIEFLPPLSLAKVGAVPPLFSEPCPLPMLEPGANGIPVSGDSEGVIPKLLVQHEIKSAQDQILQNFKTFCRDGTLPKNARIAIAALLTRDVENREEICGFDASTLRHSDKFFQFKRIKLKKEKRPIPEIETNEIREFLIQNSFVKSGQRHRTFKFPDFRTLYERYSSTFTQNGRKIRGKTFIRKYIKDSRRKINFRFPIFDRYLCPICFDEHNDEAKRKHQFIVKHQKQTFDRIERELKDTEMMAVFDFTTIHDIPTTKIRMINITMITKENNQIKRKYFDYMAEHKQDGKFVKAAFDALNLPGIEKIRTVYLFSDNGLKTNATLQIFDRIKTQNQDFTLIYNTFAPYHGHSICDSHFGSIKNAFRKQKAGQLVRTLQQFNEFVSTRSQAEVVEIDENSVNSTKLEKIKSYYCFHFLGGGHVRCISGEFSDVSDKNLE